MILIFGGAYQGKSDFAKKTFGLSGSDISFCHEIKTAGADGDSSRPDENFGIDFSVVYGACQLLYHPGAGCSLPFHHRIVKAAIRTGMAGPAAMLNHLRE